LLSKSNKKSALSEMHGVEQPKVVSSVVAQQIQQFRKNLPTAEELITGILERDKTALSRAITWLKVLILNI
jgi:LAO/AO transport system kinase